MSFRSIFPYTQQADRVEKLFTEKKYFEGAKASNLGMSRTGMASALDGGISKAEREKLARNFGKGYVQFEVKSGDANTPLNIGGRLFYPRADKTITIVDDDFLTKQLEIEKERRAYLEDVLEKASISNEICSIVLGVDDCTELLGPGKDGGDTETTGVKVITDEELKKVDATPAMIETYDPSSITYSRAISKFKRVVQSRLPIVSKMTPDSVENKTIG